ncbi:MAG: class I SAM-dependent methyltransferase [Acidobacteriota bacterium]|nr:class I SAM-dependent methyltransferase [Acidobacteriota bacterium]
MEQRKLIVDGITVNLALLQQLQRRPEPFEPGEAHFWDDPYIAEQMLAAHLDPQTDAAASRRPEVIDREAAWLIVSLSLRSGSTLIDLGCGPGLYAARFAQRGLAVTGIDYAQPAIAHARAYAERNALHINYLCQDFLAMDATDAFDAAILVNGDFCAMPPEQRERLLRNVHRALKPGGRFALDVFTREYHKYYGISNHWYVAEEGFWRPGRHLVLEEGFAYPKEDLYLNQYIVIESDGKVAVYRNWFQNYTPATITAELERNNFAVEHLGGDLRGSAFTPESEWIGVVARKVESVPPRRLIPPLA